MSRLDDLPEPTEAELWAIEAETDVLLAELALVDAETALFDQPSNAAASAYLQALLDLIDLHDFTDHEPAETRADLRELAVPLRLRRQLEEAS